MESKVKKPRGRPRKHPRYEGPKRGRGRPRKDGSRAQGRAPVEDSRISRRPSPEQIRELVLEMVAAGEYQPGKERFRDWLRLQAERDLFFFTKWIFYQEGERRGMLGAVHREMARFVTDYRVTRRKLVMLPMGHLKTSFCSQSFPLHVLIQRPETNIYFPGRWGCDQRILLGNESEDKCKENLSVIRQHLESNVWVGWLWPHICWENPKTDSPTWQELKIVVPRNVVRAEATVTAIGALTGVLGRHYDVEALDDIAGTKAGNSWEVMAKVKKFKRTARSRLHSQAESIEVGIGTHQSADDVYVDWQKDLSVETMIRAIEENNVPLWPENPDYTPEAIEKMRAETDPILWALWYMNKPVSSGFTAMDWSALREFRWDTSPGWMSQTIEFDDTDVDHALQIRKTATTANPLMRFAQGMAPERTHNRAMTIRRAFGNQSKPDSAFLEHMQSKHGCPGCEHKHHEGDCTEQGCDCRYKKEARPWEMVLKGPM